VHPGAVSQNSSECMTAIVRPSREIAARTGSLTWIESPPGRSRLDATTTGVVSVAPSSSLSCVTITLGWLLMK
jgi:hypothetical protein